MAVITIVQLEHAINRARDRHPPIDGVLHASVRTLAEIYGRMIYAKAAIVELDGMPASIRDEVFRWLPPADAEPAEVEPIRACFYRPGDPGFEECEACQ